MLETYFEASGHKKSISYDIGKEVGKAPLKSFTPFENFWHGVVYQLAGSSANEGRAIVVEKYIAGAAHKNVTYNADGSIKTITAAPIATKIIILIPQMKNGKKYFYIANCVS